MPLDLYLIGLGHYDLQGSQRLEKLLLQIFPDIVSVEYDKQAVKGINLLEKAKKSPQAMRAFIENLCAKGNYNPENVRQIIPVLNFEYFVARDYCKKWGKPLLFSDFGDKNLSQRDFDLILSRPVQATQELIERVYQNNVIPIPPEEVPNLMKRDEYTETKLRPLAAGRGSRKVLHVAGAWHLFGNYCNLYERVRDLNPCRIMLKQADYF